MTPGLHVHQLHKRYGSLAALTDVSLTVVAVWLIASLRPLLGIGLWRRYGGTVYAPELTAVLPAW